MQELVGHCLQLLQENHTRISSLEEYLQQYGYKPPDNLSVPVDPLELVMPSGKITSFLLQRSGQHITIRCALSTLVAVSSGEEDTPANMQPDNPSTSISSIKEQVCVQPNHSHISQGFSSECIRTVKSIAH